MTDKKLPAPADAGDSMRFAMRTLARAADARGADNLPSAPVRWVRMHPDVEVPTRGTPHAAGYDVKAYLRGAGIVKVMEGGTEYEFVFQGPTQADRDFLFLEPGMRAIIPTGLKVALPENIVLDVRPRSGNSYKQGLLIANSPGTVDEDYRGQVGVIVSNPTDRSILIAHGDRIAQFVFLRVEHLPFVDESALDETERGEGAFGSTGT